MPYIKSCKLSGYRSIKNVSCDFKNGLNILIGNNGSGKSNFLEFMYKVLKSDYADLDAFSAEFTVVENENTISTWNVESHGIGQDNLVSRKLNITEKGVRQNYYTEFVKFSTPDNTFILSEEFNPKYNFAEKRFVLTKKEWGQLPLVLEVIFLFFLNSRLMNLKNIDELTDEYLHDNLNDLFEKDIKKFRKHLLNYTPVEEIRLSNAVRITKLDASLLEFRNIVFEYKINGEWFPWNALSDGTKRLLYIILKVEYDYIPLRPFIFIEEPEIGIHPHQLHLLLNYLKEQSKEVQIIISTQSPQVLDILSADELERIKIAEIDYENGTIIRGLTEQEISKAQLYLKDESMLSDYWRFSDFQRSKQSK